MQSIEKAYSADAAGFGDDSAVASGVGARLEWIAGEWVTWLVGFCSANCRSASSQHIVKGGDVRLTEFPDPHLQHLVLSCQILSLGLIERALVSAGCRTGQHFVSFVRCAWKWPQGR